MPHPSKSARKARHAKAICISAQLRDATNRNRHLAQLALNTYNQSAHLAQMVAYLVARHGTKGVITIPAGHLAGMPDGAKLRETYDPETDSVVLTSIVVADEQPITENEVLRGSPRAVAVVTEALKLAAQA